MKADTTHDPGMRGFNPRAERGADRAATRDTPAPGSPAARRAPAAPATAASVSGSDALTPNTSFSRSFARRRAPRPRRRAMPIDGRRHAFDAPPAGRHPPSARRARCGCRSRGCGRARCTTARCRCRPTRAPARRTRTAPSSSALKRCDVSVSSSTSSIVRTSSTGCSGSMRAHDAGDAACASDRRRHRRAQHDRQLLQACVARVLVDRRHRRFGEVALLDVADDADHLSHARSSTRAAACAGGRSDRRRPTAAWPRRG